MTETRPRKNGYIPLAANRYGGIFWQGEGLKDFWMWNRQYITTEDGSRVMQTVRVGELKEAALRCWRDGWVPVSPVDDEFVRRMEDALRRHQGLKKEGVTFPEGTFLEVPVLTH